MSTLFAGLTPAKNEFIHLVKEGRCIDLPYLELNGKRFFYAGDIDREGLPVLFCHGSGGRHQHWLFQMKGLKDIVNPIAVDLPGHGRSEGSPENEIKAYREWLNSFIKAAGIGPFIAVGHSMGGAIALDYTLHYPDEILGVILVGSGGRLRVLPDFLETLRKGTVPKTFFEFLYGPEASTELLEKGRGEIESTDASVYYADLCACDRFDVMEDLPRIKQPILIICGSEDLLTPVKYSHYLKEKLPRGQVEVIGGAGHMVMLEKPESVNRAIERFIEQLDIESNG